MFTEELLEFEVLVGGLHDVVQEAVDDLQATEGAYVALGCYLWTHSYVGHRR